MKSLNDVKEYLGIQNSTLYTWMKVTQVKSVKQSTKQGTRAYLDDEAIAILEELKIHLESGGTFESWGQSEMVTASPESIEYAEMSEMFTASPELELEELPQHNLIADLMNNAQRQAAGVLIAQNVLARKFIDDPDSLPPEYLELVNKSKPLPKSIDPLQYAQTLTGMNLDFLMESLEESLEENLAEMPESPEENQAEAMLEPLAA